MPAATPVPSARVLADGWYSWLIGSVRPFTDLVASWPGPLQALTWRLGPFRALLLLLAATRYDTVVVVRQTLGWRSVLLGRALFGRRRKLVVMQFIDLPPRPRGRGAVIDRTWRPVERWATRRAVRAAQVLSAWEVDLYAQRFGVEPSRFRHIPFAWSTGGGSAPPAGAAERRLVLAAGRAFCDWPTLFEAAGPRDWELTVVCSGADRPLVERLNHSGRATVRSDLEGEEVSALLRQAAVSVLPMVESGVSQGQIRLKDAVDGGAAVVASRTRSLEGYVEPGVTALLVEPGDAGALRDAVDGLMADAHARERLVSAAAERARRWTWADYLGAVEAFVHASR
ncbi:MAG TPA: glycosyltransferase [Solirubrobacteraceae bacterium]|jgi:glycosyltransferase involved in cell wall biosynthesis